MNSADLQCIISDSKGPKKTCEDSRETTMSFRTKLKYIRNFRHETLESLGVKVGFPQAQANSRIAQYESGYKKPRQDVVYDLAKALDVSPIYLQKPDPEYILGVLQFLFEMERIYGL